LAAAPLLAIIGKVQMPRRSGKLPASSGGLFDYLKNLVPDERSPTLFNVDWRKVERAYNKPLPADVREAMVAATQFFVLSEKSERTGEPVGRVQATIEACKRRASEFQRVLPSLELTDGLHAVFFIAKNYSDARLNDGRLFVALQEFLTSFQLACNEALKEIGRFPALKEGDGWKSWIKRLNRIANDAGLPTEVRKDLGNKSKSDKPSPFSKLATPFK
jgi:hypothetical protein